MIDLPPATRDLLERWLTSLRALDDASNATILAYGGDLRDYLGFMAGYLEGGAAPSSLRGVDLTAMRAWMAHETGKGLAARSRARALSAVKSFYNWWSEREGFDVTAVLSTRSPRYTRKLPRPLTEDAAKALLETVELQARDPWVAARDVAVVTLLYGCGLRISEALGLDAGQVAGCPDFGDHLRERGITSRRRLLLHCPADDRMPCSSGAAPAPGRGLACGARKGLRAAGSAQELILGAPFWAGSAAGSVQETRRLTRHSPSSRSARRRRFISPAVCSTISLSSSPSVNSPLEKPLDSAVSRVLIVFASCRESCEKRVVLSAIAVLPFRRRARARNAWHADSRG